MKTLLFVLGWLVTTVCVYSDEVKRESDFLGLLHELQYTESPEDLVKMIPHCPQPKADAGDDNTEIVLKTKLFGFDAVGEFNFHKGILVSHGFRILTPNYKDAHRVFLRCVKILDSQVDGLKLTAAVPVGIDGGDQSDGPADEMNIYLNGVKKNAEFQLALDMRAESISVRWGAQGVRQAGK